MSFFITTPIYYVNDVPHIGHAYCTIVADVLRRYHRLFAQETGEKTLFLTGVDEHGQKVQAAALKRGLDPQVHCDEMADQWRKIWVELGIDYDIFFRTTDAAHKKAVQAALQRLYDQGEIYTKEYEGWYSASEEIFYTEKDLVNGKTPSGGEVTRLMEKNYFFKMSKYQDRLIKHIETHADFIQPEFRRNEVLGFLRQPLGDLCISRPKSRLSWGIELPFDADYVTYVWFDALLNYTNGVGFLQAGRDADFSQWWSGKDSVVLHLLGKDILTTHAVYWPTMLMALGAPLPKHLFAHGWWLSADNEKMSKSKGNVIKPLDVRSIVGVDALRYFLTRDIRLGSDSQFSVDLVISRVNTELANTIGNLLSRTLSLVGKYFDAKVPTLTKPLAAQSPETQALAEKACGTAIRLQKDILQMKPQEAVGQVVELMNDANKYLADRAPWKQAKDDLPAAAETLYAALETLRIAGILLEPVMPTKGAELLKRLGLESIGAGASFSDSKKWALLKGGTNVIVGEPLFPRVEWKPDPA